VAFVGSSSAYDVWDGARSLGTVTLQVPGSAFVTDSLAALAAGLELGFGFDELAVGLASFRGSGRRMQFKGRAGEVDVYDSYAHHPVEIAADLQAARALAPEGKLVACFQPHLVSRTRIFGERMGVALGAADRVVVMDVYAAREDPDPAINGGLVASAVPLSSDQVVYEPDRDLAARRVVDFSNPGDVVLTLGAGDVTELGATIIAKLEEPNR
jgi:UDP-N-acetylmuramate--alanine ligase